MRSECVACHYPFERESGFYLGAIYFNYGLTALVVAVGYPFVTFAGLIDRTTALLVSMAFVLLFPLWFFRYARSLWLAFDEYFDPWQRRDQPHQASRQEGSP
jgi:hypothetical protein